MNKFKSAMSFLGDMAVAYSEHSQKVDNMTTELMRRGHDLDLAEAKKIATILVDQATVTWKRR